MVRRGAQAMYNQFDKRGATVISLGRNVGGARGAAVTPLYDSYELMYEVTIILCGICHISNRSTHSSGSVPLGPLGFNVTQHR